MRVSFRLLPILGVCVLSSATAGALTLYGNSAGTNFIHVIDPVTGVESKHCSPASGNGRGIVVVGTTAYYTVANSNNVFKLDIPTCATQGVAFSVAGATGLSTIAYDGTNFWIGDYSGTNKAFYYSPTGTLLNTITLNSCVSYCDGLEYFNGKLISNRGDAVNAPYDVYSTAGGAPTQAAFIATPGFGATGIAFDGTNFYVSEIFGARVHIYDGTTGAAGPVLTLSGGPFLVEDLSFDYQQVLPTPTGGVPPTPTSPPSQVVVPTLNLPMLGLLALALAAAALLLIRR